MAIASGKCPSCGADIEFHAGASSALVCPFCKHVVVRSDRGLESLGRVADVTYGDVSLSPGDHGTFRNRTYVVRGRMVLGHPEGGQWEEYFGVFDGRFPGWIAQAQGKWSVTQQVEATAPPLAEIQVGASIDLDAFGTFVVIEKSRGKFLAAEGELPFAAAPGTDRVFVDLSGPDGAWATLDYGEGNAAATVFVGFETTLEQLGVIAHEGDRPHQETNVTDVKCPQCGAPIPLSTPGKSERVGCPHCGALSDLASHRVLLARQISRRRPKIELGSKATYEAVEWTVLGYVERSGAIEGESFSWSEYLLYNESEGYRWLVEDEGVWWFGTPISAGAVRSGPSYKLQRYRLRNENAATVDYVVGEFYWKVEVGERVLAKDYVSGSSLLSCEESGSEVTWTASEIVPPQVMQLVFGVGGASSSSTTGEDSSTSSGKNGAIGWVIALVVIVIFIVAGTSGGDCQGGGGGGGGWGGGSGGK